MPVHTVYTQGIPQGIIYVVLDIHTNLEAAIAQYASAEFEHFAMYALFRCDITLFEYISVLPH